MRDSLEFIDRTLAALEGGYPVPAPVAREWIQALRAIRVDPKARLDDVLGIRPGRGQSTLAGLSRLQKRAHLFHSHYRTYLAGASEHAASLDLEDNLRLLHEDRNNPKVPGHYRILYDELAALGVKIPRHRTICNEIAYFAANRF